MTYRSPGFGWAIFFYFWALRCFAGRMRYAPTGAPPACYALAVRSALRAGRVAATLSMPNATAAEPPFIMFNDKWLMTCWG